MYVSISILEKYVESFRFENFQISRHNWIIFPSSLTKSVESLDLICYNVWVPTHVSKKIGVRRFIYFLDDYSQVTLIFLMNNKS